MNIESMSCVDCKVANCNLQDSTNPAFCQTDHMDPAILADAMAAYEKEENRKIMIAAAEIEFDHYCQYSRVQEVVAFAKKIKAKKIGIATCVGLLNESGILANILRRNGFEVVGIGCKAGVQKKVDLDIPQRCTGIGENICNPILQAKLLNAEKTDLNIMMGLCVGHDALFIKHAEALVTPLVVKDRVMGHNPVAALYTANRFYAKKLDNIEE